MTEGMKDQPPDRGGHKYLVEYVCLPDTVDPRGPKGLAGQVAIPEEESASGISRAPQGP